MRSFLSIVLLLLGHPFVHAHDFPSVTYRTCYDGDTCRFDIPNVHPFFGENIPIRFAGIDTPDLRGKCDQEKQLAVKARDLVQTTLEQAHSITLKNAKRGKYFRIVARDSSSSQVY